MTEVQQVMVPADDVVRSRRRFEDAIVIRIGRDHVDDVRVGDVPCEHPELPSHLAYAAVRPLELAPQNVFQFVEDVA
jgi:hypothetical protein